MKLPKKKIKTCVIGVFIILMFLSPVIRTHKIEKINRLIQKKEYEQLHIYSQANPSLLNHVPYTAQIYAAIFDTIQINTPLLTACIENDEAAVRILLTNGANPNYLPRTEKSYPLSVAAGHGNIPIIEDLLIYGADAKKQGMQTVMAYLQYRKNCRISRNDIEEFSNLLTLLIENGFVLETKDTQGETLVFKAALYGDIEVINYFLLNTEVDVYSLNTSSETILHRYIRSGYCTPTKEGVQYLLSIGLDAYQLDCNGKTVHDYAIEKGYSEIAEILK